MDGSDGIEIVEVRKGDVAAGVEALIGPVDHRGKEKLLHMPGGFLEPLSEFSTILGPGILAQDDEPFRGFLPQQLFTLRLGHAIRLS